ncbi:hypothetical protein MKS88_004388 [Plasmodium brasilianum]|uniref:Reticulocyte binding protein 2 homolog B n=2 Tax=Plasmodium (Plasmodium) TaxID=418103 RepID=A0A1A8W676_PLAMA|nr:conserved Plasmodium protein, unknown function [Plasmodium malariae]KAI4836589.1 hypothetical protein MKS88_004388 [Plasmodium brasilianum]SBS88293.1 conserved Plasmodium protein, unknown function [Plasmodium malariae]SCO93864.1 conserved Plasmodium protein, unknown function [Plasmodium malariae]
MTNVITLLFVLFVCILKYNWGYKEKINYPRFFLDNSSNVTQNKIMFMGKYDNIKKRCRNKLNDNNNINVGELKIGKVYDVINNDIYVKLKNENEDTVIIKRENNYLLENELLYDYLVNSNLIGRALYSKLLKRMTENGEGKKGTNGASASSLLSVSTDAIDVDASTDSTDSSNCVVLIKEINEKDEIVGELYTNEISKRKEKIYDKLTELKNLEKRIFIKIIKNVRNKYFVVLINDCIRGYLLYDEEDKDEKTLLLNSLKGLAQKLSAYIIDVNKKLEYVFLSLKKYAKHILNEKLEELQHTVIVENLFENNYFKAEVSHFCNEGNNIIVKIFESKNNTIKVKIKSHHIINTRNILRNFDQLKSKVITNEFMKHSTNTSDEGQEEKKNFSQMEIQKDDYDEYNTLQQNKKRKGMSKKEYMEKFKKFKEELYGCKEVDALKYINVDDYIYKKEKLLYVRIINKTLDKNMYEGSMINGDTLNQEIYNLMTKMASKQNIVTEYDDKLRYPSSVLGFFNNYVILSTRILRPDVNNGDIGSGNSGDGHSANVATTGCSKVGGENVKDVITLIEKRYIDYENLKKGDIFFTRFDNIKRRNIRNIFHLPNSTINKVYNTYFKREKDMLILNSIREKKKNIQERDPKRDNNAEETDVRTYVSSGSGECIGRDEGRISDGNSDMPSKYIERNKALDQKIFEEIFFEKHNIYIMRGELHKDTEYRLNKNNIDKSFKSLKHICDTYYSGINKAYHLYPSIREEYILAYLGKDNYKMYRKMVADYFSLNENSYKELLQVECEELASTVFDFVYENPKELTVELVNNYNRHLYEKMKKLNINELNYVLKDLKKLKNKLFIYPCSYETKKGRINLVLNNQKPITKQHIMNLNIDEDVKRELLKAYKNFINPLDYIKDLILKKKQAKCRENSKMPVIYLLVEETINLYENSAKDVEPHTEEQLEVFKAHILKKRKNVHIVENDNDNFRGDLFDPENSQLRRILNMIKEDLEKQKKKNKMDEVDKYYEEEQKSYSDATDLYKIFPQLEEMDKLTEDMFYMKIPFVE